MKLVVSSGGVPAGSYLARFVGVESIDNDYGPGLSWQWEVLTGPHTGQMVRRITTVTPSVKNACGKVLSGLVGKPVAAGEELNVAESVGNSYLVIVAETTNGGTRVETVTTAPGE